MLLGEVVASIFLSFFFFPRFLGIYAARTSVPADACRGCSTGSGPCGTDPPVGHCSMCCFKTRSSSELSIELTVVDVPLDVLVESDVVVFAEPVVRLSLKYTVVSVVFVVSARRRRA